MWADTGAVLVLSTGTFFYGTVPPTIGSTDPAIPGYTDGGIAQDHKFEINRTPEPASLALLGLGVLTFVSRRRR